MGAINQVALDQFVFTPVVLTVFFTATTLMEGKSTEDVKEKLHAVSISRVATSIRGFLLITRS